MLSGVLGSRFGARHQPLQNIHGRRCRCSPHGSKGLWALIMRDAPRVQAVSGTSAAHGPFQRAPRHVEQVRDVDRAFLLCEQLARMGHLWRGQ